MGLISHLAGRCRLRGSGKTPESLRSMGRVSPLQGVLGAQWVPHSGLGSVFSLKGLPVGGGDRTQYDASQNFEAQVHFQRSWAGGSRGSVFSGRRCLSVLRPGGRDRDGMPVPGFRDPRSIGCGD